MFKKIKDKLLQFWNAPITVKKLLLMIGCFCFLGAGTIGITTTILLEQYIDIKASSAPAVSSANQLRLYMDSTTNGLYASTNTGAFAPLSPQENVIMNPYGQVNQRGTSQTMTFGFGSPTYYSDRWKVTATGISGTSGTYSVDTAAPMGNTGYAQKYTLSWTTSGTLSLQESIEKLEAAKLANQTVVLSANVYQDTAQTTTCTMNMYPMTADDNNTAGTALTGTNLGNAITIASSTPTVISTGPIAVGSNASHGFIVNFAWATTGTISSKHIEMTDIQLQIGSSVTPCKVRPYTQELALCQRYCYVIAGSAAGEVFLSGGNNSTSSISGCLRFPVTMRAAPTFAFSGTFAHFHVTNNGNNDTVGTATNATNMGLNSCDLSLTGTGAPYTLNASGIGYFVTATSADMFIFSADF